MENTSEFYLRLFFDVNRGGFFDVAENILDYLDYKSFVQFKQSCKMVYEFIKTSNIEQLKLKKKLDLDWKHGTHKEVTVNAPGLVQAAQIFANSGKIVCSADESIILANSKTGDRILTLSGHQAVITCVDMFSHNSKDYIVSGSQDGILAIWSISDDSGECILQKQLFGRIEVVKIKYELLVTAHFGTDYDVGCITIRQIVSPVELPVIYSVYQDLFPIFCMDFTKSHLAALEWSGTFNHVHAGNCVIYNWLEADDEPIANLADRTFACCRFFEDFLITGGHDKLIRIWTITPTQVDCIRTLGGHSNVIMRLIIDTDRGASRDLDGNILIWDLNKAIETNYDVKDYEKILVRRVHSNSRTVTCIAMDQRKLVMGSIGTFCVFDYWNTAL